MFEEKPKRWQSGVEFIVRTVRTSPLALVQNDLDRGYVPNWARFTDLERAIAFAEGQLQCFGYLRGIERFSSPEAPLKYWAYLPTRPTIWVVLDNKILWELPYGAAEATSSGDPISNQPLDSSSNKQTPGDAEKKVLTSP